MFATGHTLILIPENNNNISFFLGAILAAYNMVKWLDSTDTSPLALIPVK